MENGEKRTVIEDGTEFDGSLSSRCAITLSGKLKGKLQAPALTVTSVGSVEGQVKVAKLVSSGEVSGHIEAETVELSGRVGDRTVIRAHTLEVKLDSPSDGLQVAFGNCELHVGDAAARGQQAKGKSDQAEKLELVK
jgi:cytoskeletal protein CcmA (bactofilin family)